MTESRYMTTTRNTNAAQARTWGNRGFADGNAGRDKRDPLTIPEPYRHVYADRYRIGARQHRERNG